MLCKCTQITVLLFNSGLKQRSSKTTIQLQTLVIQYLPTHSKVLTGQGRRKAIQTVFCSFVLHVSVSCKEDIPVPLQHYCLIQCLPVYSPLMSFVRPILVLPL